MARFGHAASAVALTCALVSSAHAQDQTTYTYDVHGRLTGVARPGSNTGYTYDNAQNRTHVTTTLVSGNHAPVANPDGPPAVAAGSSLTFDPRANDTDADSDSLTITGVSTNNTGSAGTGNIDVDSNAVIQLSTGVGNTSLTLNAHHDIHLQGTIKNSSASTMPR